MRKILAYNIPCVLKKTFTSRLPADFEILSVMVTRGAPTLYGLGDDKHETKRERFFRIYGNMEEVEDRPLVFIGSFVINGKVPLQLFEITDTDVGLGLILPNG